MQQVVRLYSLGMLVMVISAASGCATYPANETGLSRPSATFLPTGLPTDPPGGDSAGTSEFPPLYPPHSASATYPVLRPWEDVLLYGAYPYSTPLPPSDHTPIDGVYAKLDPGEPQWWNCLRCADFLPAGGNWRLQLHEGTFRFYYEVTGFSSVSSYVVHGDRLTLFNDPHCPYDIGEYRWRLEKFALTLEEIQDPCAIHLRAQNLTQQAWLSCQPRTIEAAISDHWIKPPGCE